MPASISTLHVSLACSGLMRKKRFGDSDPFAVLLTQGEDGGWVELGRTEAIQNCLSPAWPTQLPLELHFEDQQPMRVEVYHCAGTSAELRTHTFMGACEFAAVELARAKKLQLVLKDERDCEAGQLRVRAEEAAACRDQVTFQLHGRRIENVDGVFGKSDPFCRVARLSEDGAWVPVWESNVRKNNENPLWKPCAISMQALCNGDEERPLKFEVWDWEKSGRHKLIGAFCTCVRVLRTAVQQQFPVINEEKKARSGGAGYEHSGTVLLLQFDVVHENTMVDYVAGGCEIALTAAFDFSASTATMHQQLGAQSANPFEAAVAAVGRVLEEYDQDNRYPVYGFGAVIEGRPNDCFSLVAPGQQVEGMHGILAAYRHAVPQLQFSEPTNIAPLIHKACDDAQQFTGQFPQQYQILLVLTDGMVSDMQAAVDAVVRASTLPLSIVFAGVGQGDMSLLEQLDANDAPLTASSGQPAQRDCVHVVPVPDLYNNPARLTREVLRHIPRQFMAWYQINAIQPNPPVGASAAPTSMPPALMAAQQAFGGLGADMMASMRS